ncbi:MAG: ATP-binding protein [Acidobacteria bacterium]|nr:ATP-binding protein [Acidobacteriota bacterium]MCI0723868.1 ATP-binding protein [Acidobacteriota bacterium]
MAAPKTKASPEQVHKAVTQFSSAILTMQGVDDLERLVVALWVELQTLGLNVAYCGINIFHESEQTLDFYGVHEAGLLMAEKIPFSRCFQCEGLPQLAEALQHFKEGKLFRYSSTTRDLTEWLGRLQHAGIIVTGPVPPASDDVFNLVEVPFNSGTLVLARNLGNPFDEDSMSIIQSFGQILSFGYTRYEDLKKLEQQNKELRVGLAIDRVHVQVLAMERAQDWGRVLNVMRKELLALGMKFTGCGINIIDEEAQRFRQHIILPAFVRKRFKPSLPSQPIDDETDLYVTEHVMEPGKVPTAAAMEAWKNKTILRRVLEGEELARVAERSSRNMGFEVSPLESYPRCLLDVPFSHGLIALSAIQPEDLTRGDQKVLQQMAQAISVAYARFLDFQALEKKNRELKEAQSQLVQSAKQAAMGQLVAGVAHEINTPLGTINSNFDVTSRALNLVREELTRLPVSLSEKSQQLFATMDSLMEVSRLACARIIRIVRDLRNFARLDEADFKEVNLNEGIESTLSLLQHELRGRIEVIRDLAELPLVPCYPNRLNQVFMNLLVNAIQSIRGKGQIRIQTRLQDHQVQVAISDSGSGIKPEHLERIFDPGFTTKGVGVGTGLGLSISARIIQDHRGLISVQSEVGKGTTFLISLPLEGAPERLPTEVAAVEKEG